MDTAKAGRLTMYRSPQYTVMSILAAIATLFRPPDPWPSKPLPDGAESIPGWLQAVIIVIGILIVMIGVIAAISYVA